MTSGGSRTRASWSRPGNFHGRTISIISFSDDPDARAGFGPYTPGFRTVPYGDVAAVEAACDESTVAVLVEPIQGEGGVVIPPADYLPGLRALCDRRQMLLICDEIQSGLGRTGKTFASEHVGVEPDLYLLGKALGGGVVPVSAVVGNADVLGVLHPGQHGSTFGGNPLAAAVGLSVVRMLADGSWQRRATELGAVLGDRLRGLIGHGVTAVRCVGLWAGVDIDPGSGHRSRGQRAPDGPRDPGQGHPRFDHPVGAAAGGHRRRADLGRRPAGARCSPSFRVRRGAPRCSPRERP